jgi:hypothetical protein
VLCSLGVVVVTSRTVHKNQLIELDKLTSEYPNLKKFRKELVSEFRKSLNSFDRKIYERLKGKRLKCILEGRDSYNG